MQKTIDLSAPLPCIELCDCLSAEQVGDVLRRAVDIGGWSRRLLSFYLLNMEERRLYLATGHSSTIFFAESQLDMSARRVRELLQIGRALQSLTLIDEALRDGEISWSRVLKLISVVQRETQKAWLDYAKTATWPELRAEVAGCRPGDLPGEGENYGLIHAGIHLATDDDLPTDTRESILRRDRHRCRCCGSQFDLHVHHILPRHQGGTHSPHNLLTLCQTCHSSIHRGHSPPPPTSRARQPPGPVACPRAEADRATAPRE